MDQTIKVVVASVQDSGEGIKLFELAPMEGEALPPFTAGAHIDVDVGAGCIRQYSLCGSPEDRARYWIGVKREPASRGGSEALHTRVAAGCELRIGHPRNNFPISDEVGLHVLIAGGIGVTPMISMIHELKKRKSRYRLHYFARSPEHVAFRPVLAESPNVSLHLGLQGDAVKAEVRSLLATVEADSCVYVCGPAALIELVHSIASQSLTPSLIRSEYFARSPAAGTRVDHEFTVELARSKRLIAVPPGVSIVQALAAGGTFIDTSCEEGVCGTCAAAVLGGIPDHRDEVLAPDVKESNQTIITCVSRAKTSLLILDL